MTFWISFITLPMTLRWKCRSTVWWRWIIRGEQEILSRTAEGCWGYNLKINTAVKHNKSRRRDVWRSSSFLSFYSGSVQKTDETKKSQRSALACQLNPPIIHRQCLPVTLVSFIFISAPERSEWGNAGS